MAVLRVSPLIPALIIVIAGAATAAAQERASNPWRAPTTPDGRPDLQGVWTNATLTPLERPARFAGRPFMTEAEASELESQAARTFEQQATDRAGTAEVPRAGAAVGSYNQAVWSDSDRKVVSTRQTSLVIDPPDGHVPVRLEAEQRRDAVAARAADSYEFLNVFDRCITRGVPGGFFPAPYNNAYQIVQTPGYVVITSEMIHEARVISTDGRPHRPGFLRTMTGDSVGRWEGDTLVISSVDFNGLEWLGWPGWFTSPDKKVTERMRRVGNSLTWEAEVTDTLLLQPWKTGPQTRLLNPDPMGEVEEPLPCVERDLQHIVTRERG